jgi:hypothetical protein
VSAILVIVTLFIISLSGLYVYSLEPLPKWNIETVGYSGASLNSLALDSFNQPHISYIKKYIDNGMLKGDLNYAKKVAGTWFTETITIGIGVDFPYSHTSLDLDSSDHPHIAYYYGDLIYHPYEGGELRYIWYDTNTWNSETVDTTGQTAGIHPKLVLNSQDEPSMRLLKKA